MFIYTSLFLASLVLLLVARFIYKAICSGFNVVSESAKSINRTNARAAFADGGPGYQKNGKLRKASNDALIPLDRVNRETAWSLATTCATAPETLHNQNTTWLLREKKLELASAGKTFKVRRRVTPEPLTLDMVSKPWRRKVAPWIQNPEFVNEDFRPADMFHEAER